MKEIIKSDAQKTSIISSVNQFFSCSTPKKEYTLDASFVSNVLGSKLNTTLSKKADRQIT